MLRSLFILIIFVKFVSLAETPPNFRPNPTFDITAVKYVDQDSVLCASEYDHGEFKISECKNDINKGIVNSCIYMIIPSNESVRGRYIYGCSPLTYLPTKCSKPDDSFQPQKFYFPWTTITYNGSQISGALFCCGEDYCNESEEPPIAAVRIKSEVGWTELLMDSFPLIFCTVVVIVCLTPQFDEYVEQKLRNGMRRGETADMLPAVRKEPIELEQCNQGGTVTATFKTLRDLNRVLKDLKREDKFYNDEEPSDEEDNPVQYYNTVYNYKYEEHKVINVKREHLTNKSTLAERMIEHGPYEYEFNLVELAEMFDAVARNLEKETTILDLSNDIFVLGNIEGSYGDLFRWFNLIGWPPKRKVLFLGGLTASGEEYSLETIALIFALKLECPQSVYIVRGRSELSAINLLHRYPRRIAIALSDVILRACHYLPLAATIDNKIFCSHGGIPIDLPSLSAIRNIRRPIAHVEDWSTEADLIISTISNQNGLIEGSRAHMFDPTSSEFCQLAQKLQIGLFIRSRNPAIEGHQIYDPFCLNIWSALGKRGTNAATAVHIAKKNIVTILRFRLDTAPTEKISQTSDNNNTENP